MTNEELIEFFLDKNFLLTPDLIKTLPENFDYNHLINLISSRIKTKDKPLIINKDLFLVLGQDGVNIEINWNEFEKSRSLFEKGRDGRIYTTFLNILNKKSSDSLIEPFFFSKPKKNDDFLEEEITEIKDGSNVIVLRSYNQQSSKREVGDFVSHFKSRYESLKKMLCIRQELQIVSSINRVINKTAREEVSIIGLVLKKNITKNGNLLLMVEDLTGRINVLINKTKSQLHELSSIIVEDDVVGISGIIGNKLIFANNLFLPDIPLNKKLKTCDEEVYAVFTADLHIGSTLFLHDDFKKFIDWLNGDYGGDLQKVMAKKVKYLFIIGDIVDGIGVYPEQDKELLIKDIYKQYEFCASLLSKIRKDIKIIICSGNHDAVRLSEPQPVLSKKYAKSLWDLPNVIMVSNPSLINIHSSKDFEGFNILMYHGYSFGYYVNNLDWIRMNGGWKRADLIMKFLLQKRHLAPTHSSNLYIPLPDEDNLVIDKVPDFFVSGHSHKCNISNYNNVTNISCSCWQLKTSLQERVGTEPEPGRIPIVNLKTREIKVLRFTNE